MSSRLTSGGSATKNPARLGFEDGAGRVCMREEFWRLTLRVHETGRPCLIVPKQIKLRPQRRSDLANQSDTELSVHEFGNRALAGYHVDDQSIRSVYVQRYEAGSCLSDWRHGSFFLAAGTSTRA